MSFIEKVKANVAVLGRTVVLAEGDEERTVKAARVLAGEGIAKVCLVGAAESVERAARDAGLDLSLVRREDPATSPLLSELSDTLFKRREKKGMTRDEAREKAAEPLYFGALMVETGHAHAMVAGARSTTGDVLRAAIHSIGLAPGVSTVSSCFVMILREWQGKADAPLCFADCAVIPDPTPEQLASIAVSSADTFRTLTGEDPRVAFLSFSTAGSAEHELVDKVRAALVIARRLAPDLPMDGEMQLDAAIVPSVAKRKMPGSAVAGTANVLVFPDLNAGNIGYKLTQRVAGAEAIGPVIQGLAKPANDLSRGCSIDDIVSVSAIALTLAK